MACMFTMMNNARLNVGVQGLAIAERAYQKAVEYARERKQGQAPGMAKGEMAAIVHHADVRRMLMTMRAHVEAMRCLIYLNGAALDRAHHGADAEAREKAMGLAELLTPLSKAWCTDLGVEMASQAVQVHGGMGFIEETGVGQYYRDARILPIYEGTNGIQALDLVGRKLSLQGGEPVRDMFAEIAVTVKQLGEAGDDMAAMSVQLNLALSALKDATDWLYSNAPNDPNAAPAGATPYLRMFATTVGAHLLGRSALKARALLQEGAEDTDFLKAKIITARFFMAQILPTATALLGPVMDGPAMLFAIDEEQLSA